MTDEYDQHFKEFAVLYFNSHVSWQWFKAQGFVESSLNPRAVSESGARGIMQIMPETAHEIAMRFQIIPNLDDPRTSIMFGIFYMKRMWDIFKKETGIERLRLALASYNAGPRYIIAAQNKTDRPEKWEAVRDKLPEVTNSAKAYQAINYVSRIEKARLQLVGS